MESCRPWPHRGCWVELGGVAVNGWPLPGAALAGHWGLGQGLSWWSWHHRYYAGGGHPKGQVWCYCRRGTGAGSKRVCPRCAPMLWESPSLRLHSGNTLPFSWGLMQHSCRSPVETSSKERLKEHHPGSLLRHPPPIHTSELLWRAGWSHRISLEGWVDSECMSVHFLGGFPVNFILDLLCPRGFLISRAMCWLLSDAVRITFHESPFVKQTCPKMGDWRPGGVMGEERP